MGTQTVREAVISKFLYDPCPGINNFDVKESLGAVDKGVQGLSSILQLLESDIVASDMFVDHKFQIFPERIRVGLCRAATTIVDSVQLNIESLIEVMEKQEAESETERGEANEAK